jgi:hypothetical protein
MPASLCLISKSEVTFVAFQVTLRVLILLYHHCWRRAYSSLAHLFQFYFKALECSCQYQPITLNPFIEIPYTILFYLSRLIHHIAAINSLTQLVFHHCEQYFNSLFSRVFRVMKPNFCSN